MKWMRLISYLGLLLIIIGGVYYFAVYRPSADFLSRHLQRSAKQESMWETRLEHAQTLSYLHQYEEAELEYRQLLNLKPHSTIVKEELANLFYYQGRYDEALNLLQQIPPDQKNQKTLLLMADIHLALKHYQRASSFYANYLKQFPDDLSVQLKLAEVLSWQKEYEPSIAIYQKLLSKDPQNIQIRRHYARVLIWSGKLQEGAEEFKKTLAQDDEETSADASSRREE